LLKSEATVSCYIPVWPSNYITLGVLYPEDWKSARLQNTG